MYVVDWMEVRKMMERAIRGTRLTEKEQELCEQARCMDKTKYTVLHEQVRQEAANEVMGRS